ncbi:MAG: hypothetical protein ACRDKT_05585 [Actinomycetota bacterium]
MPEEIKIKATKVPAFKPGAEFKRIVSGPLSKSSTYICGRWDEAER